MLHIYPHNGIMSVVTIARTVGCVGSGIRAVELGCYLIVEFIVMAASSLIISDGIEFRKMEDCPSVVTTCSKGVSEIVPLLNLLEADEFLPELALLVDEGAPTDGHTHATTGS
jgi:hypothetical protein